ncbi:MAG: hypothetical protein WAT71_07050 [Ignavibacteria bacterium]
MKSCKSFDSGIESKEVKKYRSEFVRKSGKVSFECGEGLDKFVTDS